MTNFDRLIRWRLQSLDGPPGSTEDLAEALTEQAVPRRIVPANLSQDIREFRRLTRTRKLRALSESLARMGVQLTAVRSETPENTEVRSPTVEETASDRTSALDAPEPSTALTLRYGDAWFDHTHAGTQMVLANVCGEPYAVLGYICESLDRDTDNQVPKVLELGLDLIKVKLEDRRGRAHDVWCIHVKDIAALVLSFSPRGWSDELKAKRAALASSALTLGDVWRNRFQRFDANLAALRPLLAEVVRNEMAPWTETLTSIQARIEKLQGLQPSNGTAKTGAEYRPPDAPRMYLSNLKPKTEFRGKGVTKDRLHAILTKYVHGSPITPPTHDAIETYLRENGMNVHPWYRFDVKHGDVWDDDTIAELKLHYAADKAALGRFVDFATV